jgi:DNA polymerase-3 subunit alpha
VTLMHVNLHGHTTLSTGDGYAMPEEHVKRVAELGQPGLALTEHGNISSHVKLERAAKAAGVKPVFGYEAYCVSPDPRGQLKNHLTLLAADAEGYRNLQRLVSSSWSNYHYKPTTTGDMLVEYGEGLVAASGCLSGRLATSILGGKGAEAGGLRAGLAVAAAFRELLGDRYYLEVQPHAQLAKQVALNQALARIGRRLNIPLVATGDVHYPLISHQQLYPLLHAIDRGGSRATLESASNDWEGSLPLTHLDSRTMLRGLVDGGLTRAQAQGAMVSTLDILERCTVELPRLRELRFPSAIPSEQLLRQKVREGWRYRGLGRLHGATRKLYLARIKRELDLMVLKGFVDYHLVISEMVAWAKDQGIPVGPARGSAAASLVCYLLRITEVDPMPFPNLLFERYIDINRHDLPDVDLDFDDERRHEVREHLVALYGADRVGNIGTFTMYKGKNSLEDVARVHGIPKWAVDAVKEKLIERSSGDLRGNATIEDTIAMFPDVAKVFEEYPKLRLAEQLEGNVKGFSVHAAGLVVSDEPLTNSVAVYKRINQKGEVIGEVLSIDKHDAEYVNALKIDVLGLTTMGVIRRCLEMVGMTWRSCTRLPLDDESVYEGFRRNEVIGIFQFDGRAMRSRQPGGEAGQLRRGVRHQRTGPTRTRCTQGRRRSTSWSSTARRRPRSCTRRRRPHHRAHQLADRVPGADPSGGADAGRLHVGGGRPHPQAHQQEAGRAGVQPLMGKFLDGGHGEGVKNEAVAERIWKQLVTAGAYAFNAAHCVSYGMLAYWTMWLKQHHPLEFYCASLQKFGDPQGPRASTC